MHYLLGDPSVQYAQTKILIKYIWLAKQMKLQQNAVSTLIQITIIHANLRVTQTDIFFLNQ